MFPYFFHVYLNILDTVVSSLYANFGTPCIIPRVVQIMSIIFQTGHELSIVLGNESTSASARVRFPSTIE
jgi:hypothetical protein